MIRAFLESRLMWVLMGCGLLWVAAGHVREGLAKDRRFLALPAAMPSGGPAWGGKDVLLPVQERLARLGPLNLFDARFEQKVRAALQQVPGVARVREVRRLWPDRYGVSLRLHRPVAVVLREGAQIPVTARGVALPWEPYARASEGLLRITGVPDAPPRPGEPWRSEALEDGLAALRQIGPHLDRLRPLLLGRIDVSGARDARRGVNLHGADGIVVRWGRPRAPVGENPVEKKVRYLETAAAHVDAIRGYEVDVRYDEPYLRESPVE